MTPVYSALHVITQAIDILPIGNARPSLIRTRVPGLSNIGTNARVMTGIGIRVQVVHRTGQAMTTGQARITGQVRTTGIGEGKGLTTRVGRISIDWISKQRQLGRN